MKKHRGRHLLSLLASAALLASLLPAAIEMVMADK